MADAIEERLDPDGPVKIRVTVWDHHRTKGSAPVECTGWELKEEKQEELPRR